MNSIVTKTLMLLMPLHILLLSSVFAINTKPEAYTTTGLGGLNPKDDKQIISYVPGLTLLYYLDSKPVKVRKQNNYDILRNYTKATTQDGIQLLLLDEDGSLNRKVGDLEKFHFLVARAIPVCKREDSCLTTEIWRYFDEGRRGGRGWYTVWPRQGGVFLESPPNPDALYWKVRILDNVEGWVERYIPAKKGERSTEDLGYIVRMDRPYPLFRFTDSSNSAFTTTCGETKKSTKVETIEGDISAFAKIGAEISAEPLSKLPFAKQLLKFVGLSAEIKAEVSAEGNIKYSFIDTSTSEVSYGIAGGSWDFKVVKVDRFNESNNNYDHYATLLIKKVFKCEALEPTSMRNVSIQIFLGNYGVPVDYNNPLSLINISKDTVETNIKLKNNPEFPSLISMADQDDYEKILNYLQTMRGLPKAIALFIIKEINLSPSFD